MPLFFSVSLFRLNRDAILYQNVFMPRRIVAKIPTIADIIIAPVLGSRYDRVTCPVPFHVTSTYAII